MKFSSQNKESIQHFRIRDSLGRVKYPDEWCESLKVAFRSAYTNGMTVKVTHSTGLSEVGVFIINEEGNIRIRNPFDDTYPVMKEIIRLTVMRNQEVIWDMERDEPVLWVHSQ